MNRRVLIGSLVVLAIAVVLWLKPDSPASGIAEFRQPVHAPEVTQVLLFADMSEAGSSCGCGEIIRMVRAADVPGIVAVQEFDERRDPEAARLHSVHVAPTVIISGRDGVEQARFEGESPDVITSLREALSAVTEETTERSAEIGD
jgi:hypothetical protein